MTLDDYPSEATMFKIVPAYKYQKEGEQIVFANENICIVRAIPFLNKPTFISCSGEIKSNKKGN